MTLPTLVVMAYDRPLALRRLLDSLLAADYPADLPVNLLISLDSGGPHQREVAEVATSLVWPHGELRLVHHERHLGLVPHFHWAGDLATELGAIILLEDDLTVSRRFYAFSLAALAHYAKEMRVAGVSLNSLWFNGFTRQPFTPYLDGADVFFLQIPWYQGQLYTARQWQLFSEWRANDDGVVAIGHGLHPALVDLASASEWFPSKVKYLVQSQRFYVFPRQSLTTNHGDAGTHFARPTDYFQVPLQHHTAEFRWQGLDEALAVYDAFFEMVPSRLSRLAGWLSDHLYDVDLYASKPRRLLRQEHVLTTRPTRRAVRTFGLSARPIEANVIEQTPGRGINLALAEDLDFGRWATARAQRRNSRYHGRLQNSGLRSRLAAWLLDQLDRRNGL